ncbi:MAG: VOC family protein [Anaerolineae bacterium]|nr:VOC family protein [Anaerolineae bacterium]
MDLGNFSISLAVKDAAASTEFYKKFGFEVIDGGHMNEGFADPEDGSTKWRILQNGKAVIGVFQGMFDTNTITFNPTDARSLQRHLKEQGVTIMQEADETTTGPAHFFLMDPDGNPILVDQHE